MTPIATNASAAAKSLGGQKLSGDRILCPGPGHGKRDRSLHVAFDPKYPEGFVVHSFTNDDWRKCRDHVRSKLGLPVWKPTGRKPDEQPTFVVREFIYRDSHGDEYHRIDQMSDGGFKHFHWDIDGWARGAPPLLVPYELPDVLTDETIWLVRGELNAELLRDGFNVVATTYPSGFTAEPDPSFLHHFAGRDVRILDVGGALSAEFVDKFSSAMSLPVHRLPDGFRTLRQYAQDESASADGFTSNDVTPADAKPSSPPKITPTPFQWSDPSSIPPREWVYDTHLIRKFVSLTVSPGGLGKSSLALVEALSMVVGRPLIKDAVLHEGPLKVWYWNGEDPQEETRRRVMAAAIHYNLSASNLSGLFTDSGRDDPLVLGTNDREGIQLNEPLFTHIEDTMIAHGIDVFMADPFVSAHRLGENDNNAIDALVKRLGKLADRTNAAVEIVHHVRKPSNAKEDTDVNDARGASALLGGVRSARVLNVMSKDISSAAGVPEDMRLRHFSVSDGKANMTPRLDDVRWRRLESVNLGNATHNPDGSIKRKGDNVGVVVHFELPKEARVMADLSNAEDEMRLLLSQHDDLRHWTGKRGSPPKNWLGHRVLEALGILDGDHDAAIRRLINTWVADKKVVLRTAWEKGNQNIYLTLPADPFAADNTTENPDDPPF